MGDKKRGYDNGEDERELLTPAGGERMQKAMWTGFPPLEVPSFFFPSFPEPLPSL